MAKKDNAGAWRKIWVRYVWLQGLSMAVNGR